MTKLGELVEAVELTHATRDSHRTPLDCPLMRSVPGALEAWWQEWREWRFAVVRDRAVGTGGKARSGPK